MVSKRSGCLTQGSNKKMVTLFMIVILQMMSGYIKQMEHLLLVYFPYRFVFLVIIGFLDLLRFTHRILGEVWPGPCVFPDFTQSKARSWWACLVKDFISNGVDGIWNDMNEPTVFKVIFQIPFSISCISFHCSLVSMFLLFRL